MAAKVCIVNYQGAADYKVCFVDYEGHQKNHHVIAGGTLVDYEGAADVKVCMVEYEGAADI